MNAKKILVPIDFSPYSDAALNLAATLARDSGATLLVLHVDEVPLALPSDEFFDPLHFDIPSKVKDHEMEKRLNEISLRHPGIPFERYQKAGDPSQEIVRLAKEQHVDFIVMGTHGRRGLPRLLMGSVAEVVMRRAPCPLITVKHNKATAIEPSSAEMSAMA